MNNRSHLMWLFPSPKNGTMRGPSVHWPKMSKQISMQFLWSMGGVGIVLKSFHQNLLTWWKIYRLLSLLLRSKILHRNWHCNHTCIFNLTEFFQGHNFFQGQIRLSHHPFDDMMLVRTKMDQKKVNFYKIAKYFRYVRS